MLSVCQVSQHEHIFFTVRQKTNKFFLNLSKVFSRSPQPAPALLICRSGCLMKAPGASGGSWVPACMPPGSRQQLPSPDFDSKAGVISHSREQGLLLCPTEHGAGSRAAPNFAPSASHLLSLHFNLFSVIAMGRSWAESHFLSKAKSQRIGLPFYQKAHLREQKALNNEVWAAG